MIEKGDTVRFIDEALEGTVTALLGKDKAEVLTTDGFSMVALLTQLVRVKAPLPPEGEIKPPSIFSDKALFEASSPLRGTGGLKEEPERKKSRGRIYTFDEAALKEEIVYAAFELIEPQSPLSSAVQLHLINNTGFTIAFSLSRKFEMRDEGIAIDKMEPRTIKTFLTYTGNELTLFECFRVQIIFLPTGKTAFRPPVQKQFRFNIDDLLEFSDFNSGKTCCLFVPLVDLTQAPEVDITQLVNRFSEQSKEEQRVNRQGKPKVRSDRTVIFMNEKTVDLHIEELVKDHIAMSNGQIIALQLKHFQYEMDQAIVNRLSKITFIHGVGTGVLKSAIREELKKFANIKFGDAPVEKFGYGATEIAFN